MDDKKLVFYVSKDGNDNWSGKLERQDKSCNDGPFATVERARDAVRESIKTGMDCDVEVLIRGGVYSITETLTFDQRDSGREGFKITYKSYPGEKVIFKGSQTVTLWTKDQGDVFKASVKGLPEFNVLYENGLRGAKARWPKTGYNKTAGKCDDELQKKFKFDDDDIPEIEDIKDLQIFLWAGGPHGDWNWHSQIIGIEDIDYNKKTLSLAEEACYKIGEGSRYFIRGSRDLLTEPGEFYYDREEAMLYYIPRVLSNLKEGIDIPVTKTVFEFKGSTEDKIVENIVFEGISVCNTDMYKNLIRVHEDNLFSDGSAVVIENAHNITIRECDIYNTGFHGIVLSEAAASNTIYGNHIFDIGHTGIQAIGLNGYRKYINKNNIIENNFIHDTGKEVGHGAGIQLFQSGENLISHNRICRTPRYSISLKSWPYVEGEQTDPFGDEDQKIDSGIVLDGVEVTSKNVEDFNYNRKNVIKYNDLSNANMDSQDTGLIETWGCGVDNIISNNWLHDSKINMSFGFGIYLDSPAPRRYLVEKNIISDLQKPDEGGKLLNAIAIKGWNQTVVNNIIADNNVYRGVTGPGQGRTVVEKNIFYNSGDMYYFFEWKPEKFKSSDYNLHYDESGRNGINRELKDYVWTGEITDINWETMSMDEWRKVGGKGFDEHTRVADPLFVDPENGDYRLKPESPAYELGFEDVNFADIGLKKDFLFAVEEEMDKIYLETDAGGSKAWVKLSRGDKTRIIITLRSKSGFVMELQDCNIDYTTDTADIVSVNDKGELTALSKGQSTVVVTVSREGKRLSKELYIIVE